MAVASKNIPAPDLVPVRRALLSVSDKTGLVEFAAALSHAGVELVSTGGTAKAIAAAGIAVSDVSELTGFPEIMDGRVKTLHPSVHGALLGVRGDPDHVAAMNEHGIAPIDLVIVNLYPFEEVRHSGADYASVVENIDIGGPAMLRAAAKNHAYVAVVTDPEDYASVVNALEMNFGSLSLDFRKRLAAKAFARTAAYDAAISGWFAEALDVEHPTWRAFAGKLDNVMRYGENPHQQAGFYVTGEKRPGVATARQLQGKQLSYNNINDTDAAYELVGEFDPSAAAAVAIIKHANPCGVAEGESLVEAYRKALRCDPVSAFGGIVAVNRLLDAEAAEEIVKVFTEVIIAPEASEEAQAIIAAKKNLRLLLTGGLPDPRAPGMTVKSVAGGLLVQSRDNAVVDGIDLKVVTRRAPTAAEMADLKFAFRVAKHVKSNAIVYAKGGATVGIGAGQMSRVDSSRIAARKADDATKAAGLGESLAKESVVASDAFFPFADGLLSAIEAGATAVIQPGGSMRDDEVIAAADEHGIAMVFTGVRHFRH
ncbi:bifunctional purine biosynthesis protein PurH [Mesorhizobium sp. L-8-10]|uniref:bifunctional phosphoribosylaminoimidazolecarboxamide formyltransferase/IMP cyclohydrolase n=1 Tax=unclassified Mesorhizobium TaxID=325217 RepID=UPI001928E3AD|nr:MULTISPECIES: bifunctional phosphoribosylaminoimidazolecarboxamide formyltransferase/IMP cyclohydrolase [unclassified Mesorhizobium]BCH21741.1 bifunctional purine biosynthesis protein PurH [Mesorhizobium sp. L-8-3]BCH29428.1 bifunctional purine biosynthesis protein PurH [Mesorhizobium sp. L-8-10]